MKKIFFALSVIASLNASAQQDTAAHFIDSTLSATPLNVFTNYLYERLSAKQYTETFAPLLNAFLNEHYQAWVAEKKKQSKNKR